MPKLLPHYKHDRLRFSKDYQTWNTGNGCKSSSQSKRSWILMVQMASRGTGITKKCLLRSTLHGTAVEDPQWCGEHFHPEEQWSCRLFMIVKLPVLEPYRIPLGVDGKGFLQKSKAVCHCGWASKVHFLELEWHSPHTARNPHFQYATEIF